EWLSDDRRTGLLRLRSVLAWGGADGGARGVALRVSSRAAERGARALPWLRGAALHRCHRLSAPRSPAHSAPRVRAAGDLRQPQAAVAISGLDDTRRLSLVRSKHRLSGRAP